MNNLIEVRGLKPALGTNCFIAPGAFLIGDLICGNDCSFWFNCVVRADVNSIRIGSKVNVQDGAVIHCTFERSVTSIGDEVSIGHNAIVHGCRIENQVLVGMGAIIMDNAHIGERCIIAAGAVVTENSILAPGGIYAGVPAKRIKDLPEEKFKGEISRIARNYLMYAGWFKSEPNGQQ
jgi:carbonic anhydrase/acetyltransferase-like protein (isoleucine patch superfamily)